MIDESGVNFINVFTPSFNTSRSQKRKKLLDLTVLFALLGSAIVKDARKMLVKLTPGLPVLVLARYGAVATAWSTLATARPEGVAAVNSETRREVPLFAALRLQPDEKYLALINLKKSVFIVISNKLMQK